MFRRLESGLPKDPVFPTDLKGLGYTIPSVVMIAADLLQLFHQRERRDQKYREAEGVLQVLPHQEREIQ